MTPKASFLTCSRNHNEKYLTDLKKKKLHNTNEKQQLAVTAGCLVSEVSQKSIECLIQM